MGISDGIWNGILGCSFLPHGNVWLMGIWMEFWDASPPGNTWLRGFGMEFWDLISSW